MKVTDFYHMIYLIRACMMKICILCQTHILHAKAKEQKFVYLLMNFFQLTISRFIINESDIQRR